MDAGTLAEVGPDRARPHAGRLQARPHGPLPTQGRLWPEGRCAQRAGGALSSFGDSRPRPDGRQRRRGHAVVVTRYHGGESWRCASGTTNGCWLFRASARWRSASVTRYVPAEGDEERRRVTVLQPRYQPREWSSRALAVAAAKRLRAESSSAAGHTLTGRPQFYVDHDWPMDMRVPTIFRPRLTWRDTYLPCRRSLSWSAGARPRSRVRYLTIHGQRLPPSTATTRVHADAGSWPDGVDESAGSPKIGVRWQRVDRGEEP